MADNAKAYSFYIPAGDESLNKFIEAQSNLSSTIRLVLKAFAENYSDRYPDVSTMDLKELVRNTDIDADKLAETAAAEKKERQAREYRKESESEIKAENEAGQEQDETEADIENNTENNGDVEEDEGYDADEGYDENDADEGYDENDGHDEESENDEIIDMGAESEYDEDNSGISEPETGSEDEQPDPEDLMGDPSGPEAEPEIVKAPEPEPVKPEPVTKPKPESEARKDLRRAYNEQYESQETATLDDISAFDDINGMMGEM